MLLVSADLEELIGLSDRLLVMLRGPDRRRARPGDVTPAELGSYMTGVSATDDARREAGASLRIGGIARARCSPRAARRIVVSSIALLIAGKNPFTAFSEMWRTIDSTRASIMRSSTRRLPYYVAGVAVAIGFKMNLFNIGADGQYLLAALLAGRRRCGRRPAGAAPRRVRVRSSPSSVGAAWAAIAGDPQGLRAASTR